MPTPKGFTLLSNGIGDIEIFIATLILSIISLTILFASAMSLPGKLGIKKILKLPVPVFVIISAIIFLMLSSLTSQPLVCRSCHPMRESAKELSATAHKGVSCIACHKKSNIAALPIQKLEQTRMVVNYLRGNYKQPIQASVGNDVCLGCHKGITRGVTIRFKVMMSHSETIEARINCIECHDGIAHGKKAAKKSVSIKEKCNSCHNDSEAPAKCDTCHLEIVWLGMKPPESWGIAHGENWLKIHGSRSLNTCKTCHSQDYCSRCHKTAVPHQEGWGYIHGQEAKKDEKDCKVCHKEDSFCSGCHQINMPHPDAWLPVHQVKVKVADEKVCLTCHFTKDCDQCHENHKRKIEVIKKVK